MKKRLFSLTLAVALCLCLVVPALAADASSLDAVVAKAYANVLTAQIAKYGAIHVQYAALQDMDTNGVPELLVVACEDETAYAGIWTMRNGAAVQTANVEVYAEGGESLSSVCFAYKNGTTYLCEHGQNARLAWEWYNFYDIDGSAQEYGGEWSLAGEDSSFTKEINANWTFGDSFLNSGGFSWDCRDLASVSSLQSTLTAQASRASVPTAPTSNYGAYTITGAYYTVSFDAAMVETRTVQIRERDPFDGTNGPYESKTYTVITVRSDSNIRISGGNEGVIDAEWGDSDGNNRFTLTSLFDMDGMSGGAVKDVFRHCDFYIVGENLITIDSTASTVNDTSHTTVSTGGYGPYTISLADDFQTYSLTFEAAAVTKTTIKYCHHEPWVETHTGGKDYPVTMVTIRPGSKITTVSSNSSIDYPANFIIINRYYPDAEGVYHTEWDQTDVDMIYSGIADEDYFSGYGKALIVLGVAEDGNPYVLALGTDTESTASATVTPPTSFTDVPANAYYASAVTWAIGKGITNGTGTNTFSPEKTCNNAEILTFIWRAMGQPEPTISNPFSNVKASDYHYKAALWAYQNGLVSGSTFNASAPCTRSMVVTYLWQASGSPYASGGSFSDVPTSASYATAVAWAVNQGITNGDGANTFSPDKTCTRGQIVTFLERTFA